MNVVDALFLDIVDYMMLSNFLSAIFKASYVRYIRVFKMIFKNDVGPPVRMSSAMYELVARIVNFTHHDSLGL